MTFPPEYPCTHGGQSILIVVAARDRIAARVSTFPSILAPDFDRLWCECASYHAVGRSILMSVPARTVIQARASQTFDTSSSLHTIVPYVAENHLAFHPTPSHTHTHTNTHKTRIEAQAPSFRHNKQWRSIQQSLKLSSLSPSSPFSSSPAALKQRRSPSRAMS